MSKSSRADDIESVEWVLPASIPFAELKGRDLEECLYWLFDAMGAKDLEWRTGGTGGGAADGGRDLEAHFYTPTIDDELEPQIWWIECKGRSGTVEKSEVVEACNNATAKSSLDYLVIATNTQFSNPTRDWVKDWQKTHKRPKVKLWEHGQLERLLSRHPDVVLRLFSEALSIKGQFQAMEARFWNKIEYVPIGTIEKIWAARKEMEFTSMGVFAAIANEFANGDIIKRSWGANLDTQPLLEVLHIGLLNVPYLMIRSLKTGVDQTPIIRAFAYLIMCALYELPAENIATLLTDTVFSKEKGELPERVREFSLMQIMDQLVSELQDVCSDDCSRISAFGNNSMTEAKDEIETYWLRFESEEPEMEKVDHRRLVLEKNDAPCNVGFKVDKDNGCPLFGTEPTMKNIGEVLAVIKSVAMMRKRQAQEERARKRKIAGPAKPDASN